MIGEVNSFTTGWVTYFRHAACKTALSEIDEWLRRKLRCVRLKHCKRAKPTVDFLVKCGVPVRWRSRGKDGGGYRAVRPRPRP